MFGQFYSDKNDCRQKSTMLWLGMFVLLLEAFTNFLVWCWGTCCLCCIIWVMWAIKKDESEQQAKRLNIKEVLMNAAALKINPQSYEVNDVCPIWVDNFEKDQNIICLPCNKGHIFHDNCIGEWVRRNNTCPLCKAPVTIEAIEMAEKEVPAQSRLSDLEVPRDAINRAYFPVNQNEDQV